MKSDPVAIVEHGARWPLLYESAADELQRALAPWLVAIEHIGSTAVPGLDAKQVIDVLVGVTSLEHSADIVEAVEALRYEYVPEYETQFRHRRYFRRLSPTGSGVTRSTSSRVRISTGGTATSPSATGSGPTRKTAIATHCSRGNSPWSSKATERDTPKRSQASFSRSSARA